MPTVCSQLPVSCRVPATLGFYKKSCTRTNPSVSYLQAGTKTPRFLVTCQDRWGDDINKADTKQSPHVETSELGSFQNLVLFSRNTVEDAKYSENRVDFCVLL